MNRSAGVTISAVIVFIGSAFTLLSALFMSLSFIMAITQEAQLNVPFMKYFMVFLAVFMLGLAAWGIASGVGLLKLREWARISMLIFSGLLILLCLPSVLLFLVMPFPGPPNVPDPALAKHMFVVMRVVISIFYGGLSALGGWWIYFFNRRSVKDQFSGLKGLPAPLQPLPARPLSITIIGWYLLISACSYPLTAIFRFPIFLLGFFVRGWHASVIMLALGVLHLVMGVGLLKLKPWARMLTISYFSFFLLNSIGMIVIPGSQARFEAAMTEVQRVFGTPPSPIHFPMWFGLAVTLPLFAVLLWFLITRRNAFLPKTEGVAPLG
jgi:hypothetical protein